MTLTEFFNPYNVQHLKAYKHLEKEGYWPEGFLPKELYIDIELNWHVHIPCKIARAWIDLAEAGNISGMPRFGQ